MNLNTFALLLCTALPLTAAAAAATPATTDSDSRVCGTLVGAGQSPAAANNGFVLREGEPVDFIGGGKTVPGVLHLFHDGDVYRVYWQVNGGHEPYVFVNIGPHRLNLISTPPQGVPANPGEPGAAMPAQQVESCPQL